MKIHFSKYHGTGNDFIIIDDRDALFDEKDVERIQSMCSRRFGIGADGLMLLRKEKGYDFRMVYFNSDGRQSTMCGNGGRCIVHFAHELGIFEDKCTFIAIDGPHDAKVLSNDQIRLKMSNVESVKKTTDAFVINTGSPHYVKEVTDVDKINVKKEGAFIRYSDDFNKEGINVNFMERKGDQLHVYTYERGVEDETYSCGTGVTACALVSYLLHSESTKSPVSVSTRGGDLKVYFHPQGDTKFTEIWLEGPAINTFSGTWEV